MNAVQGDRPAYGAVLTVHLKHPDFSRAPFDLPETARQGMLSRLSSLYGAQTAEKCLPELERLCRVYQAYKPDGMAALEKDFHPKERFTEEDIILIAYPDSVQGDDRPPLAALIQFCDQYTAGINTIHLLSLPSRGPDRFVRVMNTETVDPDSGTLEAIEALTGRYRLMFDGVIRHVSHHSFWFQEFLNTNPRYQDFFLTDNSLDPATGREPDRIDQTGPLDVPTLYQTLTGPVRIWSTPGEDQIHLNYHHPLVLLRVIEVMLFYVRQGVDILRLDASPHPWPATDPAGDHLQPPHELVKLLRDILDHMAPAVSLAVQAQGTHQANMTYLGNGQDQAHLLYNDVLPPLVLHTFYTQDAGRLTGWAKTLEPPSDAATFFNVLDTHEGIDLTAVREILTPEEIDGLAKRTDLHGGYVTHLQEPGGREAPHELNITWFSALNPENSAEDLAFQVKRFVASRAVALMLQGVPGIYLHSLIGTRNARDLVAATQFKRAVNRPTIDENALHEALGNPMSKESRIHREFGRLIVIRSQQRAFHPYGHQQILWVCPAVFALVRWSPERDQVILCLVNVTPRAHHLEILTRDIGSKASLWCDLVSGVEWMVDKDRLTFSVQPYDVIWLQPVATTEYFPGW